MNSIDKPVFSLGKMSQLTLSSLLHTNSVSGVTIYRGLFGHVPVAIKYHPHESLQDANTTISEAMVQIQFDHPNLCKAYDCFLAANEANSVTSVLVMELCVCDAWTVIRENRVNWGELELLNWMYALADALRYVQDKGVSHRNIKPSHILLTETGQPKLCDFSSSAKNMSLSWATTTVKASPEFQSPELSHTGVYDSLKTDVWALAVTFLQLSLGEVTEIDPEMALETLKYPSLRYVLGYMLRREPNLRPNFGEIMNLCQVVVYQQSPAAIPAETSIVKNCFVCRSPFHPTDWIHTLPDLLKPFSTTHLCSLQCAWEIYFLTQVNPHQIACTGCDLIIPVPNLHSSPTVFITCGHPFHNKSCFETYLDQFCRCNVCETRFSIQDVDSHISQGRFEKLERSICVICNLRTDGTIYGGCNHAICSKCDTKKRIQFWGKNCRQCRILQTR